MSKSAIVRGWRQTTLGKHVRIHSGSSPSQAQLDCNGAYPFVKVEDLNNCEKYQSSSRFYTNNRRFCAPAGSIMFPKRGAAIMNNKVRIARTDFAMDTNIMAIEPAQDIDNEFLFYVIKSEGLYKIADTSTVPQINNKHINPYILTLPPLPEQRKIAEILRTWDEAIEKLEALRAANLRRRIWMRTEVLSGETRLPGCSGDWREEPLGHVLTEHRLQSTGVEQVFSVSVHKGLINQIEHLGRSFAAKETVHYNRVLPGDIVYTKSPTGDFPLGIIKQSKIDQQVIVSPLYGVFSPVTRDLGIILDAYFESPVTVRNYLSPLVQKGAKNTIAITNKRFLEGKLRLPIDPKEQAAIAAIVNASNAERALIEAEIEALTRQKRGLMQKLLTGEWRVKLEPADA